MERTRVNRAALAELLLASRLVDQDLAARLARLSGGFPAIAERNLFLEYELGSGQSPVPAGFGLGLPWGALEEYLAAPHWFARGRSGRAVAAALADDPFAADNTLYLNALSDADPDWIEYDVADERIAPTPFVFFRPPSRFRSLATRDQAHDLCAILPGGEATGAFALLLGALIQHGPAEMYRVGATRRRGRSWWRAIITNLGEAQIGAALRAMDAAAFAEPIRLASAFYAGRMDTPGARFALSIDINDNEVVAADVECPFLFRIADLAVRDMALAEWLVQSVTLSPSIADWLAGNCHRQIVTIDGKRELEIRVHHLKVRFLGSPHLRTKAYLHLHMIDR